MTAPACPDCGAEMQYLLRLWRCPWSSLEIWDQAMLRPLVTRVTCRWPLCEPREVPGLPNGTVASE